jgi:pentapeptide repeat protein
VEGVERFCTSLTEANLERAILVGTTVTRATFTGCRVYGVSAWDLNLTDVKDQSNLLITRNDESGRIRVNNLEVAQFVYLLLHNEKIRNIIDTIGDKGVLILGRFIPERKVVLDKIRDELQARGFVPMMFDFERPTQRDFTETIKTLAGLSRFIIADITNPKSSPLELPATMPDYMIPFIPIIQENEEPFAMFRDLKQKYGEWALDVLKYDSVDNLAKVLDKAVVRPALEKGRELLLKKAEAIHSRHVRDYI